MNKRFLVMMMAAGLAGYGCAGDDGSNGTDGMNGENGEDGTDGMNGENGTDGMNGENGEDGTDGMDLTVAPKLIRIASVAVGAEITGMEKTDNGDFFFNIQHPSSSLPGDEAKAGVGVWTEVDVDNLDPRMSPLPVPDPTGADGQTTSVAMGTFQVLGREGDTFTSLPYGLGNIIGTDGTTQILQSNDPDFNAFIPTAVDGSAGYLFTAWEDRPGGVTRMMVEKADDGSWTVSDAMNVDFSGVQGTIINCFGTVSPWGTPLTSEENYEAENAENWNNTEYSGGYPNWADVQNIQTYLGGTFPNPYDYGYIVEIEDPTGTPTPKKLFTLGRMAHENAVIMPDWKTVYTTDDGTGKAFYKFVADTAGDLSSGTLYAAKLMQDATRDPAKAGFDIQWIALGSSNNTEIEAYIDTFDSIDETAYTAGSTNYIDDAAIATWWSEVQAGGAITNPAIPFVESLRAARAAGATAEFDKMEGININYDGVASGAVPFMYVAMSDVRNLMVDDQGDIQVDAARCGIVYRFGLTADYDVRRMEPVVVGGPYDSSLTENQCDVEGIAQPDNVAVLDDGRVLIGEDTGNHVNNMLWIYNPMAK